MYFSYHAGFIEPIFEAYRGAWIGHIPFASWITATLKPKNFVELGTHTGGSYLAFCQTIKNLNLSTKSYAVDIWSGDEHSGFYGEEIYLNLRNMHDPIYNSFSQLLKMSFDDALSNFENNSIDLLHIDGFHTYEAVKHDFEAWLPKISSRGVVLLHDTNVYERNFGVHRLYKELSNFYPCFDFKHSYGLGVVLVGSDYNSELLNLATSNERYHEAELIFRFLGTSLETRYRDADRIQSYAHQVKEYDNKFNIYEERIKVYEDQIKVYQVTLENHEKHINDLLNSNSWRITKLLRMVREMI